MSVTIQNGLSYRKILHRKNLRLFENTLNFVCFVVSEMRFWQVGHNVHVKRSEQTKRMNSSWYLIWCVRSNSTNAFVLIRFAVWEMDACGGCSAHLYACFVRFLSVVQSVSNRWDDVLVACPRIYVVVSLHESAHRMMQLSSTWIRIDGRMWLNMVAYMCVFVCVCVALC